MHFRCCFVLGMVRKAYLICIPFSHLSKNDIFVAFWHCKKVFFIKKVDVTSLIDEIVKQMMKFEQRFISPINTFYKAKNIVMETIY